MLEGRKLQGVPALLSPEIRTVLEAASRKGVALAIRLLPRSTNTVEEAAAAVHAQLGQIVKAVVLVASRPGDRLLPIVCLVAGRSQVDLRLAAALAGEVTVRHATAGETLDLTGFLLGGVPPFGYGRHVRVLLDQGLCQYESVWAAAGTGAAVFRISPRTLRALANAVVGPFAGPSWTDSAASYIRPGLRFEAGAGAQAG